MKQCPRCGTPLDDHMKYCYECGSRQSAAVRSDVPPYSAKESYEDSIAGKSMAVAAVLSVLYPGLGHVYIKRGGRGLGFAVFYTVLLMMVATAVIMQFFTAGEVIWPTLLVPGFMAVIVWMLAANDCRTVLKGARKDAGMSDDGYERI